MEHGLALTPAFQQDDLSDIRNVDIRHNVLVSQPVPCAYPLLIFRHSQTLVVEKAQVTVGETGTLQVHGHMK